ncbi:superkiller complex protein 3-like [Passer domesticus]|uniref:superkiller complex protein 3-like n=1 Tax=Passer domesticus TaxID=48849 RepID=UPI0030FEB01E
MPWDLLLLSWKQVAEIHQTLIQMKQEEGAEKAELHQLWKKMLWLLKNRTQNQRSPSARRFQKGLSARDRGTEGERGQMGRPPSLCILS